MTNDPIRVKCMEFLYSQLEKKVIPQIRPGMLEDLIGLVEGIRQEDASRIIANRMEHAARISEVETQEQAKVASGTVKILDGTGKFTISETNLKR